MVGQLEGRLPVGRFLADWLLAGQLEGRLPVGRFPADWLLCGQLDAGAAMRGAACWDGEAAPAFGRRIKSGAGKQAGCAGADDNAVVNHAGEFLSF